MCRNSELTFTISFFIYLFILKLIYVNCFYMKILIDKILYYVWNKAFEVSKKKKKKTILFRELLVCILRTFKKVNG